MRRTYERDTKARLSFSGRPHAPVNRADSMEVNIGGKKNRKWHSGNVQRNISYAKFSKKFLEVLRDFHRLFGSRKILPTSILHTVRHVHRSVWPAREAKPRFGDALDSSAHDCETRLSLARPNSKSRSVLETPIWSSSQSLPNRPRPMRVFGINQTNDAITRKSMSELKAQPSNRTVDQKHTR